MAQDSAAGSSQSTTTQSTTTTTTTPSSTDQSGQTSTAPANQGAMSNDATQTGTGEQTVDGCLMKDGTSYSIQPANGGAKTDLSPSRSLDAFVGQHIRVSGSDQGGQLTVARIQPVSATCDSATGATGTSVTPSSTPPQQ
jgi:hypothetical protein